jgi:4-aminobutyrate--pyruvate transaminase
MSARLNSLQARDLAYYMHPYTNAAALAKDGPLIITRGEGVYVFDETGKRYLEGFGGLWCTALGFDNERLVQAAARQMRKLPFYHAFNGKSIDVGIELAEKLINMAPVPMSKVLFSNSGSEACDSAIKLIWYYHNAIGKPEKKKIIGRIKGYHGVTVATAIPIARTITASPSPARARRISRRAAQIRSSSSSSRKGPRRWAASSPNR